MDRQQAVTILGRKTTIPGDGYTWEQINEAIDIAITALSPPNEPLTLDELREMDGEPVYSGKYKRWFLVIYFNALNKSQLMDRTGTPYITEDCAPLYRRPPEGEEEP